MWVYKTKIGDCQRQIDIFKIQNLMMTATTDYKV
jgi:hypothetical protein